MTRTLRGGSLCTGYGGLDLAVAWTLHDLGIDVSFVWDSDIKPAAKTLLEYRRPHAPNLGDIHDIATPLVDTPPVDLLTFGWPCQPHSAAGKRLGEADPRAIWPQVHRVIEHLRPTYLFGENVARVASNGELRRVVRSLAEIGYVGAWRTLRASDVGAPHRRDRLFLFACRTDAGGTAADALGLLLLRDEPGRSGGPGREGSRVAGDDGPERAVGGLTLLPSPTARLGASGSVTRECAEERAARRPNGPNPDDAIALLPTPTARLGDERRGSPSPEVAQRRLDSGRRNLDESVAAHLTYQLLPTPSQRDGRRGMGWGDQPGRPLSETIHRVADHSSGWGQYAAAIARWEQETGDPAPPATSPGRAGVPRLCPKFVSWMMGLPTGWVTDVPGLTRAQQLSLLGDGVVPQQARRAYHDLIVDLAATLGSEAAA